MAKNKRALSASVVVLVVVGSIGFLNLSHQQRFQAFHTVDVLQLVATGVCYGIALAGIFSLVRGTSVE